MRLLRRAATLGILFFAARVLAADTNIFPAQPAQVVYTNRAEFWRAAESARSNCIAERRIICGRIVRMVAGGLVIDSGYTNLMRHPLDSSWLISGTVEAKREPNQVEQSEPDSVCIGLVYLTDAPKSRRAKPKMYDYVVIEGFPAGNFSYTSLGTIQRNVRHFSASLPIAVQAAMDGANK